MNNNDEKNKTNHSENASDRYPEIKEAIEAMRRISTVEGVKAKDIFECAPSYFPMR